MNLIVSGGHFTGKIVEQLSMKDEFNILGNIETAEELVSLLSDNSLQVDVILLLSTSFSQTSEWSENKRILNELTQILVLDPSYKKTKLNLLSLDKDGDKFSALLKEKWGDEGEFEKYLYYQSTSQNINPKFLYSFVKGEKELFEPEEDEKVDLNKNEEKLNKLGLNFTKRELVKPKSRNTNIGEDLRNNTNKEKTKQKSISFNKKEKGKGKLNFPSKKEPNTTSSLSNENTVVPTFSKVPEVTKVPDVVKPTKKKQKSEKVDFNKFKKKNKISNNTNSLEVGDIESSGGIFVFTGLQGVGVTTTAAILSYALAKKEDRVLFLDLDTKFMGSNFLFNEFWDKADGSPTHGKGLTLSMANPDYWEDYITLINGNLYYLSNDLREIQAGTIELDNIKLISLISSLQTKFKYIIIDLPLTDLYRYSNLVDWATRYIFLAQNTIPSVCQLAQGLDISNYYSSKYYNKIFPWNKLERKSVGVLTKFKEGNSGLLSRKESTKMYRNLSDKIETLEFKTEIINIDGIEKSYQSQNSITDQIKNIYLKVFSQILK